MRLPASWKPVVGGELAKPYFQALRKFLDAERTANEVYPPEELVFNALSTTPFDEVRVVILGQDPYHDTGQAHGLAFSVPPGIKPPPSLQNIFKELQADLKIPRPTTGCLLPWAEQGVLLLNTVLTVRAHQPNSHRNKGWETFTDTVISRLSERVKPVVFVFWVLRQKRRNNSLTCLATSLWKVRIRRPCPRITGFLAAGRFPPSTVRSHRWGKKKSTGGFQGRFINPQRTWGAKLRQSRGCKAPR